MSEGDIPELGLEYGFMQRDWQSRLLPEAIEPQELRVVVNPTNKSANDHVRAQDLPMNASLAADLVTLWRDMALTKFPYGSGAHPDIEYNDPDKANESWARVYGLLPPAVPAQGEMAQRDWLLREAPVQLTRFFNSTENTTRSDIAMAFSHIDISPTIRFDAITIDVEFDPVILADVIDTENGGTRHNKVRLEYQCGPWAAKCMMPKPRDGGAYYGPPAEVRVFGSCINSDGTDELQADPDTTKIDCPQTATTSLMVLSIGKRLIADSLTQTQSTNSSNVSTVVKNMRRVYTFMVAKLSWELSDLAVDFNADCSEDVGSCKGLRVPLTSTGTSPPQQQELIVGVDALPTNTLEQPRFGEQRYVPLVVLREPQPNSYDRSDTGYDALAGDPLLPHNIGNISWLMTQPLPGDVTCNAYFEQRLQMILNNHMYIEHGLQTAYTAATFFLLQNGVVKNIVKLNATQNTLNFQQYTLNVALLASIPDQNAWLTIGGCIILAFSLCGVVGWTWITSKTVTGDQARGLGRVTTTHVIARVMLDSAHFPPLFLHRRVVGVNSATEDDKNPSVDGFAIDELTLQPLRKESDTA